MTKPGQFASDNYSGICPEALEYMLLANEGDAEAYGEDEWTRKACDEFRVLFETDCDVFFAFNGTAANSLALASLCQSYHSVIAHQTSHVETDECGAPEFFSNGSKLLLGDGAEGKLSPESIAELASKRTDIHYPKPKVISITQATEQGTVYTIDELQAIKEVADHYRLKIHMDGARFANACISLGKSPAEISWKQGVDVLCFSGTKNGMAIGEAIVFFDKQLAEDFSYRIKQAGQLASKMRFLSAPWLGMLKTGAWEKNARHANLCAAYLAEQLCEIPGVNLLRPCEANAVFVALPEQVIIKLRKQGWRIYTFIGAGGARFVCSWNSDKTRIDQLVHDVKQLMAK